MCKGPEAGGAGLAGSKDSKAASVAGAEGARRSRGSKEEPRSGDDGSKVRAMEATLAFTLR